MPSAREAENERRRQRIAQGLCRDCGTRPALEGYVRCERCLTVSREQNRRWAAAHPDKGKLWWQKTGRDKVRKAREKELCMHCLTRPRAPQYKQCQRCLDRQREYYDAKNGIHRMYAHRHYALHADEIRAKARAKGRRVRVEVLEAYGGRCACCGCDTQDFLTLHHVNGDGKAERERIGGFGTRVYIQAKKEGFPDTLQVLCWNCHMSLTHYGSCPHQLERTPEFYDEWVKGKLLKEDGVEYEV